MSSRIITGRFVLVTLATFAFYVCVGVLIPTLPVFIENGLGSGEAMIGASMVVFSLAAVACRPALTFIGTRFGRRALMSWGAVIGAGSALMLVVVDEAWQVIPARILMGIGEAAVFVGAATLAVELTPDGRKAESASYLSVAVFGGISVGPIIGEWAMGVVPESARGLGSGAYDRVFVITAVAAALCGLVSLALPAFVGDAPHTSAGRARFLHPRSTRPGIVMALGFASWTAFNTFVPGYAKELGLSGSSVFFAVYSVLCLAIRLLGARLPERMGLVRSVAMAMLFILLGPLAIFVLASTSGLLIGTVFFALGVSFIYPSLLAIAVEGVDESERVQVVASFTMFFEVGSAVGALFLGIAGQLFGKRSTFLVAAVFAAVGMVALERLRRQHVIPAPV
jgi:MFS family permease